MDWRCLPSAPGRLRGEEQLSFTSADSVVRQAAVERIKAHISLARRFNALIIIGLIRGVTPPGQSQAPSLGTW